MAHDFKDYEHLLRLAGLFVAGIIVFVLVRAILVPDDFGVFGHYRAGALEDNMAVPVRHAGAQACLECHDDVAAERAGGGHEGVRCEACHGPLAAHAEDPTALVPEAPDAGTVCLRCHLPAMAKRARFPQVDPVEHADGEPCDTCHVAHAPKLEEG